MLMSIARFEARYQLRSPLFAVAFALFFLLAFGSATSSNVQLGSTANVHINSPFAILQTVGILNLFALFAITGMVAGTILRDDETGFAPLVRSTRMTKADYLIGRFLGAFAVAWLVTLAVPLGNWAGSLMPWVDSEKIGPRLLSHYLYAALVFGLPTVLALSSIFFAVATATRSLLWTFIGVVLFVALYALAQIMLREPQNEALAGWLDPFGLSIFFRVTRYWTAADRNTLLPPLDGVLLQNRLAWLAVAAVAYAIAYRIFGARRAPKLGKPGAGKPAAATALPTPTGPLPNRSVGQGVAFAQFRQMVRFDMAYVFRSPAFLVLMLIGLFNAVSNAWGATSMFGADYLPVTRMMVDAINGAFNLFALLIVLFYGGELVWRDRECRIHDIIDANPAPDWAFMLPKVLAITGVVATVYAGVALGAMAFQLTMGYRDVQPLAYLLWFWLPNVVNAVLLGVLCIVVQTLVPNKFMGWGVMVLYVIFSLVLSAWDFEHALYQYGETPSVPLSDMNGMGHFWIARAWFHAYWVAFAGILLVLAQVIWRRGADVALRPRLARLPRRLRGSTGGLLALCTVAWLGLGGWIFYNTNILNHYVTQDENDARLARMERELLPFETLPQPTITHVTLNMDLQPKRLWADVTGSYRLENRTGQALREVHVLWNHDLPSMQVELPGSTVVKDYADFSYRILRLAQPMQPGEQRTLNFRGAYGQRGFKMRNNNTRIVANGSFIDNMEIAPYIGMSRNVLLSDRTKRRKLKLPDELRAAKLEDDGARAHHYLRHDTDWVTADITLTTDADQVPLAPGYTVSDTTANGRRTLVTKTEAPIHNFFSLQSARYAIAKDVWTGKPGQANAPAQPVQLAVYHHPAHDKNVRLMLDAMKASLDIYSSRFSPYQFRQARILEFPAYASFAQAFAGTMPYSEGIGFIQNFNAKDADTKIDLVTYVTAHEVAHQWWAHQVIGSDQQGMTLTSESFAQYSALLVMEHLYGKPQLRKFLKHELDSYLRKRGGERLEELPLARVENQPYIHYEKGAVALYLLKDQIGEEHVNRAMQRLIEQFAFKAAPYPRSVDFIALLKQESPARFHDLIDDTLSRITLYDLSASAPQVVPRADGQFDTTFTVRAKKFYADGKGQETEAPLDISLDIGAFRVEPGKKGYSTSSVLAVQRQRIHTGEQQVTVRTAQKPSWVGIDPFNTTIDRNSNDNLVEVK